MLFALIVDNSVVRSKSVVNYLKQHNYDSIAVSNVDAALEIISGRSVDVVFLWVDDDLQTGLHNLDTIIDKAVDMKVVIIAGKTDISSTLDTIKRGAYDFLFKPVNIPELVRIMEEIEQPIIQKERRSRRSFHKDYKATFNDILSDSPAMMRIINDSRQYANTNIRILLTGQSGTGKGLLAQVIHNESPRKNHPFIAINCAAIPEYLFESEFFGYEQGAFTDAVHLKKGLVEFADKGTIFIDEIGDMPIEFQAKLLKVIDDNRFYRIGGEAPIDVDVRFIAATNQDIKQKISSGAFREDLYFRLAVVGIEMPPLSERKEDIIPLALIFLKEFTSTRNQNITDISEDVRSAFLKFNWPGNIRELKNYIERMTINTQGDTLQSSELPIELTGSKKRRTSPAELISLKEIERRHIVSILKSVDGNRNNAAEILGIARSTLFEKIRIYNIRAEEFEN